MVTGWMPFYLTDSDVLHSVLGLIGALQQSAARAVPTTAERGFGEWITEEVGGGTDEEHYEMDLVYMQELGC